MHREFPHLFLSCTVCQCVEYQHLFNYPNLMDLQVVSNLLLLQAMPWQLTLYGRTPLRSSVTLSQSMFLEEVPELVTAKPGPLSFGTLWALASMLRAHHTPLVPGRDLLHRTVGGTGILYV